MLEVGAWVAQKWMLTRGRDHVGDLLPGPFLPVVIDRELLVEAEKELRLSLRAQKEARLWLRDGFWERVHREFHCPQIAPIKESGGGGATVGRTTGVRRLSKRVIALSRSPVRVRTMSPVPSGTRDPADKRRTPAGRWLGSAEVEPAAPRRRCWRRRRHDISALVLEGHRGHGHEDVVGQQGHQRLEIGRFVRPGEPRHDLVLRESGGGGGRGRGRRPPAARPVRARLRALVTDSTVESSMPATSFAGNPRTSRRMSTATGGVAGPRGRSRTPAKRTRSAHNGPPGASGTSGTPARQASGNGSSQTTSPSRVGYGGSTPDTCHAWPGVGSPSEAR